MQGEIRIIPIHHIPEIKTEDNLVNVILKSLNIQNIPLENGDILVITQKIVSKSEGRIIDLSTIKPSSFAQKIADEYTKDARYVEVVLQESKRIVRMDHGVTISETQHGFICANAGVDESNAGRKNVAILLPKNPDESARKIRDTLQKERNVSVAVILSDTWGRPWREGQVNFAIGTSGLEVLIDYRGKKDSAGFILRASIIAVADELASAAELVTAKIDAVPAVLIKGYTFIPSKNGSQTLLRDPKKDMFR